MDADAVKAANQKQIDEARKRDEEKKKRDAELRAQQERARQADRVKRGEAADQARQEIAEKEQSKREATDREDQARRQAADRKEQGRGEAAEREERAQREAAKKKQQEKADADVIKAVEPLETEADRLVAQLNIQQPGTPGQLEAAQNLPQFLDDSLQEDTFWEWQRAQTRNQQNDQDNARNAANRVIYEAKSKVNTQTHTQNLQTQWDGLVKQFSSQKKGTPDQLLAARNVARFHDTASMSQEDRDALNAWKQSLDTGKYMGQQEVLRQAKDAIFLSKNPQQTPVPTVPIKLKDTRVPPPQIIPSKPVPTSTKPTTMTVVQKPTPPTTGPLSAADRDRLKAKFPTFGADLLNVFEDIAPHAREYVENMDSDTAKIVLEMDKDDRDESLAVQISILANKLENHRAMQIRAATAGLTELQYVISEGYPTVNLYLNSILLAVEKDREPSHLGEDAPAGARDEAWLQLFKEDVRSAIAEGIIWEARNEGFQDADAYAAAQNHSNIRLWSDQLLKRMHITLDELPSRTDPVEDLDVRAKWRAWAVRLNEARRWDLRIGDLFKAPDLAPVLTHKGYNVRTGHMGNIKYCIL